ncbi:cystinosin homolog isoform X2 [Ischnura elegans]|uniref:cystinosin homolog isoform X2 n=1 Tax=Ischnura elegans TaxID=197161 RepID=UPI001ED88781|nr:cystinosin homolog isoform X2 [Ischnura elegans]
MSWKIGVLLLELATLLVAVNGQALLHTYPHDVTLLLGTNTSFELFLSEHNGSSAEALIFPKHEGVLELDPTSVSFNGLENHSWVIEVHGVNPGLTEIDVNVSTPSIDPSQAFVRVTVQHSNTIVILSQVVGWLYFVAWSVSFYPQVISNWKRKSVVGLNFDFLSFNILGFVLYSVFNCGLYFIPYIEAEYAVRYPRGLNPVLLNDVFFSCHAAFATAVTIIQCFLYEKGNQKISYTARGILLSFALVLVTLAILSSVDVIHWLDFLYACSYIKLAITLIKYVPQAYMNYLRKSTEGWSIGNIFCDFTGGTLSMLQMILNGYNYDDWASIFGDPTKFGLGLFSVLFDFLFFIQHYVLYRNSEPYNEVDGDNEPSLPAVC